MKTRTLILLLALIVTRIYSQNLDEKGVSLIKDGNDYIVHFELMDFNINSKSIEKTKGVKETFEFVELPEYGITYEEGKPQLPQLSFCLAIPYDHDKPTFEIIKQQVKKKGLKNKPYPNQHIYPSIQKTTQREFKQNNKSYSTEKSYPDFVDISETFIVSGVKGVRVTILPFDYDPIEKKLLITKKGSFKIKLSGTVTTKVVKTESLENYLSSFFVNYADCQNDISANTPSLKSATLKSASATSSAEYPKGNYLMLVPWKYDDLAFRFFLHKRALGYNVFYHRYLGYECFSYLGTSDCITWTSPDDIKSIIQSYYDNTDTRPENVLLIGDYNDIGTWEYDIEDYDPASDLGYAQLDGSDIFADVNFGRWSVSDEIEMENVINKTIEMETKFRASNINPKRCTFIADWDYDFWDETLGFSFHDDIEDVDWVFANDGYTDSFIFEYDGGSTSDISSHLNDGTYCVLYRGHGGDRSWGGPDFDNDDIDLLTNSIYPIVFSIACNTGDFVGNPPCMGEKFIREENGACAFWGATCPTDHYANHYLNKHIFENGFLESDHLSKIINLGIKELFNHNYIWSIRENEVRSAVAFNLLGDPSLKIRFNECLTELDLKGSEVDNGEQLEYPIASNITLAGEESGEEFEYVVKSGGELVIKANESIVFLPGFKAESGSTLSASITSENCTTIEESSELKSATLQNVSDSVTIPEKKSVYHFSEDFSSKTYPNPFNNELSIAINSEKNNDLRIKIYDINGSLLKEVIESNVISGKHQFNINCSDLASGIYIIKISAGSKEFSDKLIKN